MKRLEELAARLTGISTPFGGASWKPAIAEREVALRLLSYLEDRRVLFELGEAETPHHAIQSVLQIREYLTELLQQIPATANIAHNVRALRAGAREFLTRLESKGANPEDMKSFGHWASWEFLDALGRMRGGFGIHLAVIAERYDCPVPKTLTTILPPVVNDDF